MRLLEIRLLYMEEFHTNTVYIGVRGKIDADLVKRDKVNLDIFWLKDKSLEDSDDLPLPDVLAQEIADDLQTALEQFTAIAEKVKA
jgi:type I restriction enzyme M protein